MKKALGLSVAAFIAFAASLFAADVNGKWTAEMTRPDGEKRVQTFTFKTEGEKLTGTVASQMGERPIEEGKVSGDEISFAVTVEFGGQSRKMMYKGKVAGEEIKFTVGQGERAREFTAKRTTS
jgi:hypothetical protein